MCTVMYCGIELAPSNATKVGKEIRKARYGSK